MEMWIRYRWATNTTYTQTIRLNEEEFVKFKTFLKNIISKNLKINAV